MRRSQHLFLEIPHTETLATWSQRTRLRSEEHTSELQSPCNLVCRLLLEKKKPHATRRAPSAIDCLCLPHALLGADRFRVVGVFDRSCLPLASPARGHCCVSTAGEVPDLT